jgi:Tfp pilus assembly protein PilX
MPVNDRGGEDGFTMIMTVIGLSVIAMLVLVAVSAVGSDARLSGYDLNQKQAYEAAKAGLDDYAYHLHIDNGYWAKCTNVEEAGVKSAVNQKGSTANFRYVPGNSGASYAIELIPATGQTQCNPETIVTATTSMLETLGAMKGTFRIRSTGFAGKAKASITATFKPASFLDYVYFTQLETSDPVTYSAGTIPGAYTQCSKTIQAGRTSATIPNSGGQYCRTISFVGGDKINGPLHTNDALVICNEPTFGRTASDPIEVSSPPKGWYSTGDNVLNAGSNCTGNPKFTGTYRTNSPVLIPPSTNSQLSTIAEPQFRFKNQVRICLSGTTMTVNTSISSGSACTTGGTILYSGSIPSNGVVYVSSGTCTGAYSPFEATYPTTSECGNVYVHGEYSGQLTIAAENDIIIDGSVKKSGEGMLGLIANNFIRIYHPFENVIVGSGSNQRTECRNQAGSIENITVDAAILAINHSFIVDNYDCGGSLGTLNVLGAISQKYRGAVGTTGGTGYLKNYVYDDRLHTLEPPSFIEPVQSDWVIGRETVG